MIKDDDLSFFEDDEFKRHLERYEQMLQSHQPTYLDADELTDIAEYYAMRGEQQKADACVDYALHLHPGSTDPLIFKARQRMLAGDYDGARKVRDTIEDSTDKEVIYLNAELMIREGHIAEANHYLHDNTNTDDEEYALYLYDVAAIFADYNCTGEGLDWVEAALREMPDDAPSKKLKVELLLQKPDNAAAIKLLEELLNEDPYAAACWNLLAEAHFAEEQYNEAINDADFALAINEKNADALMTKANSFYRMQNFEMAHTLYQHYMTLNAEDELAYFFDGMAMNNLGKHEEALELLLRADDVSKGMSSEQMQINIQLAFTLSKLGYKERALAYIDKALEELPDDTELLTVRGHILLENGASDEAFALFEKVQELAGDDDNTIYQIAISLFDNDEYARCTKLLESLVKRNGEEVPYEKSFAYLAVCHLRTGNIAAYLHYLKLACQTNPEWAEEVLGDLFPNMNPSEYYIYAKKMLGNS